MGLDNLDGVIRIIREMSSNAMATAALMKGIVLYILIMIRDTQIHIFIIGSSYIIFGSVMDYDTLVWKSNLKRRIKRYAINFVSYCIFPH